MSMQADIPAEAPAAPAPAPAPAPVVVSDPTAVADLRTELAAGLAAVTSTVEALKTTVSDLQKTLKFVYGAALIVVGAVGGPSAVTALLGK